MMDNLRECESPHCGTCKWFSYLTIYSEGECTNPARVKACETSCDEGMVCDRWSGHDKAGG